MKKEKVKEEKTYFHVICYFNLYWTNRPCWGDNVTAEVSTETAKINLKLKKKTDYCIDFH